MGKIRALALLSALLWWAGCSCDGDRLGNCADEVCNGLDDDCDGETDEEPAWAQKGETCFVGQGACQTAGVFICDETDRTGDVTCSGTPGTPGTEICNGIDDDCDGFTDDDPMWANLNEICTDTLGGCLEAGIFICDVVNPSGPTLCSAVAGPGVPERCNGLDDDCDGATDEGPAWTDLGLVCTVGDGACAVPSIRVCDASDPDGPTVCEGQPGSPVSETCNGIDDDCDRIVDNNLTDSNLCTVQTGVCAGSIASCGGALGFLACGAADYGPDYEQTELSCDGRDNDCDGSTDNGLPPRLCTLQTGVCAGSFATCSGGTWRVCTATEFGSNYEVTETTCDSLDNDCDGQTDDGFVNGGKYDQDTACGSCFTNCTTIFANPNAYGTCDSTGAPFCQMTCCTINDQNPACDRLFEYQDADGVPGNGCEFQVNPLVIYVSDPTGTDIPGCGGTLPCKSIGYGLTEAGLQSKTSVYVSGGAYYEDVVLVDGVNLKGGHNYVTWGHDPTVNLTVIYGTNGAGHRAAVTATGITTATTFDSFVVYGALATDPGSNSYGIKVSASNGNLQILDNTIFAGPAANGLDGANGISGANGFDGAGAVGVPDAVYDAFDTDGDPCGSTNDRQYTNRGVRACGGVNIGGGNGGGNVCPPIFDTESGNDGANGSAGTGPLDGAAGLGGDAGDDGRMFNAQGPGCCSCELPTASMTGASGQNGIPGLNGTAGVGCTSATGTVAGGDWVAAAGTAGAAGGHGGGGGGGGAGGSGERQTNTITDFDRLGAHGGGGGAGGCAGGLGGAATSGGGSFGIFVNGGSAPVIRNTVVYRSYGGAGGDGGGGGVGGAAGNGGAGGTCPGSCWCYLGAGKGGEGGAGGHGGGGGGGCGGGSFGIYTFGVGTPTYCMAADANFFNGGTAGLTGAGGTSFGSAGTDGAPGALVDCSFN